MLTKKILEYTKREKELYLPYLADKWGVHIEKLTEELCKVWSFFENPRMDGKLLRLNVDDEPVYYEICDSNYERGNSIHRSELWDYCVKNEKPDQHISVFAHDELWLENYRETGSVSCSGTIVGTDYIYLELDRPTFQEAIEDAYKFYRRFKYKDYVTLWFSGNKSVHIQIDASLFGKPMGAQNRLSGRGKLIYNIAHDLADGMRYENVKDPYFLNNKELKEKYYEATGELPREENHLLRQKIENIDPNLFHVNSLIRQPYSIHEKGGARKMLISTKEIKNEKNIKKSKKKFAFVQKNPYLIHKIYEHYESKVKDKFYKPEADEEEIVKVFADAFKYFDPNEANPQGWINGLYSPFYKDTNNSVSVNIKTGFYIDFGEPTHKFSFDKFKEKLEKNFTDDS